MDAKGIIGVIICVLVLFLSPYVLDRFYPDRPVPVNAAASTNIIQTANGTVNPTPATAANSASASAPAPSGAGFYSPHPFPSAPRDVRTLENNLIRTDWTPSGGGIQEVVLKTHPRHHSTPANKKTAADALPDLADPISLNTASPLAILDASIGDIPFHSPHQWSQSDGVLHAEFVSSNGLKISKEFRLGQDYQLEARIDVKNQGSIPLETPLRVSLGMTTPMDSHDDGLYMGLSFYSPEKKANHQTLAGLLSEIQKQGRPYSHTQNVTWAAVKNRYFSTIVTPPVPFAGGEAWLSPLNPTDKKAATHGIVAWIQSAPLKLAPGQSTNLVFSVYMGPKEYDRLVSLKYDQDEVLELGRFIGPFSKALIWTMGQFHGVFNQWGVAIVCVTILIKILFWPLTAVGTRSMKQMQALAPEMNKLKEKHKDNPAKVNEEMIKLYREYKINPLMGCLPMLVQIPIFFAFYSLLSVAVELRGAPFLWITDLSMPDTVALLPGLDFPINPMPLLMAVTMIWQTRITPQPPNADPSMKLMIWIMPAMFLFFCYNFSSGLSLYWTVQNLLTVLQTYLTRDAKVEPPQKTKKSSGFTFGRPIETKSRK